MTELGVLLIAMACALSWMGIVAPAILHSLPIDFGLWGVARRKFLGKTHYVWAFGVFSYGLGMFLFSMISKYLEWKLLGDRFSHTSPTHIIVGLLIWLAGGWLFGVFTAPQRNGVDSASE
jgi:hypothetical protein